MQNKNNKKLHFVYGYHASIACIANQNRNIKNIFLTKDTLDKIPQNIISPKRNLINIVDRAYLNKKTNDENHQGIMVTTSPLPQQGFEDFIQNDFSKVVILDQLTDPRNIGAIMRTAHIFGCDAVFALDKNAPNETPTMLKTATGAFEFLPYIKINNLKNLIDNLKKNNYWILGMDGGDDSNEIQIVPKYDKFAIIMGEEGKGIRRLTRDNCDAIIKIPMFNQDRFIDSFNVSNAASIALFSLSQFD